jgi:hypothetical protein
MNKKNERENKYCGICLKSQMHLKLSGGWICVVCSKKLEDKNVRGHEGS